MKQIIITLTATTLLSSCGLFKNYERPADIKTSALYGESYKALQTADSIDMGCSAWRNIFTDPELQTLIEAGLQQNTDMRSAKLLIEEAEVSLKSAKLAFFPSLVFGPQGSLSGFDWSKATQAYTLPLSASWQVDVFGSLRNAKKRAQVQLENSKAYRQAVQAQLISTIANYYYTLAMLDAQLQVSQQTAENWKKNIETTKALMAAGQSNDAAVSQSEANYYNVCKQVEELKLQIHQIENNFSTILAETPREIKRNSLNRWNFPEKLNAGIPVKALARRPDIKQAELALASAFYTTNEARAAFYPALNLSGTLGWTNSEGLVNPGKWIWQAIGQIAQPIFQNGKLRANLKISKSKQEAAKLQFQQALLNAGAEVNTILAKIETADKNKELTEKQVKSLERAVKSTRLLLHNTSSTYLEVLTAEQGLLNAQLAQISVDFNRIQYTIELYQALGGGTE